MAELVTNIAMAALIGSAFIATAYAALAREEETRRMVLKPIPVESKPRRHPRNN